MRLTDPKAIALLQEADNTYLNGWIHDFDNEEGLSDIQVLYDDAVDLLELWEEDGCRQHDELLEAKALIKDTQDGKVFHGFLLSAEIEEIMIDVRHARSIIAEYRRLKGLVLTLEKMRF